MKIELQKDNGFHYLSSADNVCRELRHLAHQTTVSKRIERIIALLLTISFFFKHLQSMSPKEGLAENLTRPKTELQQGRVWTTECSGGKKLKAPPLDLNARFVSFPAFLIASLKTQAALLVD